jgi:cytoskeletal protein CcmA (bactofilin family)
MFVMAIWKEPTSPNKDTAIANPELAVKREPDFPADVAPSTAKRTVPREAKESIISGEITITGKIDGAGHVRLLGRFEGDVHIQGDLTVEAGAKLTGGVRARSVTIGGEIEGNIEGAESVEILSTGILNGDLTAGTLTVASGSRMRGRVEFGWNEESSAKSLTLKNRQAS